MRFKPQHDKIIIHFCRMTTARVHFFQTITRCNITISNRTTYLPCSVIEYEFYFICFTYFVCVLYSDVYCVAVNDNIWGNQQRKQAVVPIISAWIAE